MKIDFTKEQFEQLAKLVYLGNWMANAIEDSPIDKKKLEGFDDLESYVFSYAKDFGFDDWAECDDGDGVFYPTSYFENEEDVEGIIGNYDDDNFWQELADRLAARDFARKYDEKTATKMDWKERCKKAAPLEEKWNMELEKHGIDHLDIK